VDYAYYRTHNVFVSKTYKDFARKFGQRVVELRKSNGLTQEELAHKAEIERSYMGAIERGEKNPTLKKLFSITKALNVKATELF